MKTLVLTAFVLLLASAGLAYAAPPARPSVPSSPGTLAVPGACSAPDFLLAASPLTTAAKPASTTICGCGDTLCIGKVNLGSCGSHRVCLATGSCSSTATASCVCVTQDPLPRTAKP